MTWDQMEENRNLLQGIMNDFDHTTPDQDEGALADEIRNLSAEEVVKGIRKLGLPAERVVATTPVPVGSVAITGQFLHANEGNRKRLLLVGLGTGQSRVGLRIEAFGYGLGRSAAAEDGPRKLLEFVTHAGSLPGAAATDVASAEVVIVADAVRETAESSRTGMGTIMAKSVEQGLDQLSEFFRRVGWMKGEKVTDMDR
jgi:hypothetical protein